MPATWTALDSDTETGDSYVVAALELEARTNELRSCHIGSAAPSSPVAGMIWIQNDAVPWRLWLYTKIVTGGETWEPLGPLSRLPGAINADPDPAEGRAAPHQHKALRVENVAALAAAAAGNAGMLQYVTGTGELYVSDQPVSGGHKALLSVAAGNLDTVDLELSGDVGNDATNPPTQAVSDALEGWQFDATAEKRTFAVVVPKNWDGASDLRLRLWQVLTGLEDAGDDIEWSGEVRALAPGAGKTSQTATALAAATTDIGADADGIAAGGGPHVTDLVIDFDDATNPVATGSLLLVTINRTTVGGAGKVGGVLVFRAALCYRQRARHERA